MTKKRRSMIHATKMKILRAITGKSQRERIRTSRIREELEVKKLCAHMGETRLTLRWSGHVYRIDSEIISKKIFKWKYKNRIGVDPDSTRKRWMDDEKEWCLAEHRGG